MDMLELKELLNIIKNKDYEEGKKIIKDNYKNVTFYSYGPDKENDNTIDYDFTFNDNEELRITYTTGCILDNDEYIPDTKNGYWNIFGER